jgi:hypothetical protein
MYTTTSRVENHVFVPVLYNAMKMNTHAQESKTREEVI